MTGMRLETNAEKVRRLMEAVGRAARGSGRVYLTGGATAVLEGWRDTTVDVDLKLDPEPAGIFEALRSLKDELDLNVELASPDDFIPALPGWRERSRFIGTFGPVTFFHYDLYGQALSKIARGHARDLDDVAQMFARGLVDRAELLRLFEAIEPQLIRYPSIDPEVLRQKVKKAIGSGSSSGETLG